MLVRLIEYARQQGLDAEPGFTTRKVRWLVQISGEGELINVLPLGDGKSGEPVVGCPDMHNMNAGGRAHFLVETVQTVALLFKDKETDKRIAATREKHVFFLESLRQASTKNPDLEPLAIFLSDEDRVTMLRERLEQEKAKPADWLRWEVAGRDPLRNEGVREWWRSWRAADLAGPAHGKRKKKKDKEMLCLLTGESIVPLKTQPKIKGLSSVGGLGTGDVLAGFDKASFCSFGLKKASNAAMAGQPVQQFVDGFNHLIRTRSRRLAGVLVVHWFKEAVSTEEDPLSFIYEPPGVTEATAMQSAREILAAIRSGRRPVVPDNRYYAMTISGASGRVMVRDWMEGSFEELVDRTGQWFADLEIVARDGRRLAPDPKFMAVCGAIVRDLKDIPAPTVASLWHAALAGLPIPRPFVAQALARFRADLVRDQSFNHARVGLMKAYFIRKGGQQMTAYLNREHPSTAYQCGRLLAILAGLQRAALGDVGAGVVQRYYVAASQTPGLFVGRLIANAKNHLGKLDGGLAHWYEDQIAEIMGRIRDAVPATLDLEGQTMFALGYYQQIAANRAGKKDADNGESANAKKGEAA